MRAGSSSRVATWIGAHSKRPRCGRWLPEPLICMTAVLPLWSKWLSTTTAAEIATRIWIPNCSPSASAAKRNGRWSRSCGRSAAWCEKGCEVHPPDFGLDGASCERDVPAVPGQADAALPIEGYREPLRLAAFERDAPQAGDRFGPRADQQVTIVPRPLEAADA